MFSQIKDRKHIEQNFHSVPRSCPGMGLQGAGGVKSFSLGICDGVPSTARSSFFFFFFFFFYKSHSLARTGTQLT